MDSIDLDPQPILELVNIFEMNISGNNCEIMPYDDF